MSEKLRKNSRFSLKVKAVWSKFLSFFKKDKNVVKKDLKVHSRFRALIAVQYRDKVDTSWTHSLKTIIQKVVFIILKFVLIAAVIIVLLQLVSVLFQIQKAIMNFYLIFLGFYTILNLISVTLGLVKSLYHADDNKVLATYPTTSAKLFLSKILVFELFELKKSFDILLPITVGFFITGVRFHILTVGILIWSIIPMLLIITITVLLGALLSIPALFIYNFLKKHPIIEGIVLVILAAGVIVGLVFIINLIPENKGDIDINKSYAAIKTAIDNFTVLFAKIVYPVNFAYRAMVGESGSKLSNEILPITLGRVGIMVGTGAALFGLAFLIIKPFYFNMMTKTFEFNKDIIDSAKKNKRRERHWSIVLKEVKLTLRDFDISGSYLAVYIAVPILLLFIDKIFRAMSTNTTGDLMVAAFNLLLIALPLLASSTMIATLYSREGRTAYIKKTKPIRPYFPLTAKLFFNLIFVIPSIAVSCYIFTKFTNQDANCAILMGITILFLQYGHIFFSASLDIMNPQNEVYATEGTSISNPNERRSTIVAFVVSFLFTAASLLLFKESNVKYGDFNHAFIKLLIVSFGFAASCILLFFLKVKAFYIDRQEASKE